MNRHAIRITRRHFSIAAGAVFGSVVFGDACSIFTTATEASEPRLDARPRAGVQTSLKTGPLGLSTGDRDGLIQVPAAPKGPMPLLVFLHGATQNAAGMVRRVGPAAEQAGVVLLAPESRGVTWDAIRGSFGDDIVFLNRALERVFANVSVDARRIAIGGFSDGASYALSLGIANGDLFPRVVACSPGFVIPTPAHGRARFFVSHGTSTDPGSIMQPGIVPRRTGWV